MPSRRRAKSDEDTELTHVQQLYLAIKAVIRRIPKGRVATYGQVAELAGIPGGARISAAALKTSTQADALPWQRVIGKAGKLRGRIAIHDPVGAAVQRELLVAEGVAIGDTGLVALDVYGWLPGDAAEPTKRRLKASAAVSPVSPKAHSPVSPKAHSPVSPRAHSPVSPKAHSPVSPKAHSPVSPKAKSRLTTGSFRGASPRRQPRSASKRRASSSRR